MCDYSIKVEKTRKAKVGDKLRVTNFGTGTKGFSPADDTSVAVCVLPGTELAFEKPPGIGPIVIASGLGPATLPREAIFKQINKDDNLRHHDALEFIVEGASEPVQHLLTFFQEGLCATVLQLPAKPTNKAEREEQRRAEWVG